MSTVRRFATCTSAALVVALLGSMGTPGTAAADRMGPEEGASFARAEMAPRRMIPPVTEAQVRVALARRRSANLAVFHRYVVAKVYPSNTMTTGSQNVWRDDAGHFCAAATMVRVRDASLTDKVADQDNFIRLRDVSDGPLMDWMLTSGLTQDELAEIQKPFNPVVERPAPSAPIVKNLRVRETARLARLYAQVERKLAAGKKRALAAAAHRLVEERPDLANQLVNGGGI